MADAAPSDYRIGFVPDHLTGTCTLTAPGSTLACGKPARYRVARSIAGKPQRGMRCTEHASLLAYQQSLPFPPGPWID